MKIVIFKYENYLIISKIKPQTLDQYWSTTCSIRPLNHGSSDHMSPIKSGMFAHIFGLVVRVIAKSRRLF